MSNSDKSKEELLAEIAALRARLGVEPSVDSAGDSASSSGGLTRRDVLASAWIAPVILTVPIGAALTGSQRAFAQAPTPLNTPAPGATTAPTPISPPTTLPTTAPTPISPPTVATTAPTTIPATPGTSPPTVATTAPTAFPTAAPEVIPVKISEFGIS